MRKYEFWAQQGQAAAVADVLRQLGLQPRIITGHVGRRGNYGGCSDPRCCDQRVRRADVVQADLPPGVSKRSVDRALALAGVPGARR